MYRLIGFHASSQHPLDVICCLAWLLSSPGMHVGWPGRGCCLLGMLYRCVIYGLKSDVVTVRIFSTCYVASPGLCPWAASARHVAKNVQGLLGGPFSCNRSTCTASLRVWCPLGDSWEVGGVLNKNNNVFCQFQTTASFDNPKLLPFPDFQQTIPKSSKPRRLQLPMITGTRAKH